MSRDHVTGREHHSPPPIDSVTGRPISPPQQPAPSDPGAEARKASLAYLTSQRGLRTGDSQYTYMPTAEGDLKVGILTLKDLNDGELLFILNEQTQYLYKARAFPGGDPKGEGEAQAMIDMVLPEYKSRGNDWTMPADQDRAPLTVPVGDHPLGR